MTTLTTFGSGQVIGRFRGSSDAIVAAGAIGGRHDVSVKAGRLPAGETALVASNTIQRGRNVGGILATCIGAVMATGTVCGRRKSAVIHAARGQPGRGFMAGVTSYLRDNVIRRFARRNGTVVTRGARTHTNPIMAELGVSKILRRVTSFTTGHSWHMLDCLHDVIAR